MAMSRKIQSFISQSSWIRRMFEEGVRLRQIHGAENVFDFSLGNPNVDPPAVFKEELRRLAAVEIEGMHGTCPTPLPGYAGPWGTFSPDSRRRPDGGSLVLTCGAVVALNVI